MTAGQHRRRLISKRPPNLLQLEYPGGDTRSGNYPSIGCPAPIVPVGAPRPMFALTVTGGVAAAIAVAVIGVSALGSSGTPTHQNNAAAGVPLQVPARQSAHASTPARPVASAGPVPSGHGRIHRKTRPTSLAAPPSVRPVPQAPPRRSQQPTPSGPAIVVRYLVDSQWPGGFQGQVQVVNDGKQPITGWQIVIALQGDAVRSIRNASGYFSNGILLLQPVSAGQVVPAGGGVLNVFFVARGISTTPMACAFNGLVCG